MCIPSLRSSIGFSMMRVRQAGISTHSFVPGKKESERFQKRLLNPAYPSAFGSIDAGDHSSGLIPSSDSTEFFAARPSSYK